MMDSLMNKPVEEELTYEDVVNAYNKSGDKKDVAKRFCISVSEVTKILKDVWICILKGFRMLI